MTKPRITKLLTVAVLAVGAPAFASPDQPVSQQQTLKPRRLPNGRPACGNTQSKVRPENCDAAAPAPVAQQPIQPRTLPSGSPACGNTMGKDGVSHCDDGVTTAVAAPVQATPVQPTAAARRMAPVARRILAIFGITDATRTTPAARPREYKNGRAANGNIPKRAAYRPEPEEKPRETPREPNAN